MKAAETYYQENASKSGSSFYYSFLFLPKEKKAAIQALYAFCREVDDIVDECTDKDIAQTKLNWWRTEVERIYQGEPEHPLGRTLQTVIKQYPLRQHLFEEILQGMQMDITYQGYQTFEDLKLYCHCVASTVGLLAVEIFGYKDLKTLEFAKNLGLAFQMVNIIRDIGEDALRGRIYIPEEELKMFSIAPVDIFNKRYTENFKNLMIYQAKRARQYYQTALKLLPEIDKHSQKTSLIMAEIYFSLLKEIEKSNFQVLHQKISLTPLRKFWIAFRTARNLK